MSKRVLFFLYIYLVVYIQCSQVEPVCSKFDYEYKTLEAMLRTERRVEDMKRDMLRIQDDVTEKLEEIREFKLKQEDAFAKSREQLGEEISNLKMVKENMSKSIDDHHEMAKRQLDEQSMEIKELSETLSTKVDAELDLLNEKFRELQESSKMEGIAFSVAKPNKDLADDRVPTFTQQITNIGGGYNQTTGKFTCTMPGIYMFSLTVASTSTSQSVYCYIRLNGKDILFSYSYESRYTTVGNTVFLHLSKGDIVSPAGCAGESNFYAVSFSGALISRQ